MFEVIARCERARAGLLRSPLSNQTVPTPACFLHSRNGVVPHLTNDVAALIPHSTPAMLPLQTLTPIPGAERLQAFGRDAKEFYNFQRHVLYGPTYDPATVPEDGFNEEGSISVWGNGGRHKVKLDEFVQIQKHARLDFIECLADVQTSQVSLKRQRKCVARSLELLDETMEQFAKQSVAGGLFGVVCGGQFESERERSALETAKRNVAGFAIEGLNTGESVDARKRLLDIVIVC